jgi:hypothetical protein
MKNFFFLSLIALIISSCGSSESKKVTWKKYESTDFSIDYPNDWKVTTESNLTRFTPPIELDKEAKFNFNVVVADFGGVAVTLDDFATIAEQSVDRLPIDNAELISNERVSVNKMDCQLIKFSGEMMGIPMILTQYCFINSDGKGIILTHNTDEKMDEEQKSIVKENLASFTIK